MPLPLARSALTVVLAGLVTVLAACAQTPLPQDTFYRLEVPPPTTAPAQQPVYDGMVEVRPLEADGILAERAIAYIEADGLAVRQYSYHFWIEAPTQAVQRELSNYLRATGLFGEVVTPRLRARPDIEVQGRIGRFEQILDGNGGSRVMIELELGASHTGRGLELLFLETYRVETPAPDGTPTGASIAFREGLGEIFDRFGSDLAIRLAAQ